MAFRQPKIQTYTDSKSGWDRRKPNFKLNLFMKKRYVD